VSRANDIGGIVRGQMDVADDDEGCSSSQDVRIPYGPIGRGERARRIPRNGENIELDRPGGEGLVNRILPVRQVGVRQTGERRVRGNNVDIIEPREIRPTHNVKPAAADSVQQWNGRTERGWVVVATQVEVPPGLPRRTHGKGHALRN